MLKVLLLSLCCGLLNTGQGRGEDSYIHHWIKEMAILAMIVSAYAITNSYWSALFPLPLLCLWWYGTGKVQPYFIKYFEWQYWEFIFVFTYCIFMGSLWLIFM